jgi:hypothetical protein
MSWIQYWRVRILEGLVWRSCVEANECGIESDEV